MGLTYSLGLSLPHRLNWQVFISCGRIDCSQLAPLRVWGPARHAVPNSRGHRLFLPVGRVKALRIPSLRLSPAHLVCYSHPESYRRELINQPRLKLWSHSCDGEMELLLGAQTSKWIKALSWPIVGEIEFKNITRQCLPCKTLTEER